MTALIHGILKVKSVNLSMVSNAFEGDAKDSSVYRKFQRFFEKFDMPISDVSKLILAKIPCPNSGYILCMDRTNWQLGKRHINILTVGILVGKICVPIVWMGLPQSTKNGNSSSAHRKRIIRQLLEFLPSSNINALLMDREFLGSEWLEWLESKGIAYVLRIKKNTVVGKKLAHEHGSTPGVKSQEMQQIWDSELYFGSKKIKGNKEKDLFVVSNRFKGKTALEMYRMRWGIELLFSHLKKRGFNFEDTHMTDKKKQERLMAVLSLSFLYSYGWGLHLRTLEKQTKFLSRKSDFRYGLDSILKILYNPHKLNYLREYFFEWVESGQLNIDD